MVKCFKYVLVIALMCGMVLPATSAQANNKVVIAIDAGHGGKDPGAIGKGGLREKDVNFAVAQRLKTLLDNDPMFQPVLTRTGDYFISVSARSDIARNKNANFLVSIHADAALNAKASGASVWVLSNKRADTELGRWLEQQDKQSELLGGGGDALAHSDNPYLNQAVLDLQFANSQRVGYDMAVNVLTHMKKIGRLHKTRPEHVSFGVLRSPDIPSILVEVGFISNLAEEKLLKSADYQNKIAKAIYDGLKQYYRDNPLQSATNQPKPVSQPTTKKTSSTQTQVTQTTSTKTTSTQVAPTKATSTTTSTANTVHVVKKNETLFGVARQYNLSVAKVRELNNLKSDTLVVGQKLKVSGSSTSATSTSTKATTSATSTSTKTTPAKATTTAKTTTTKPKQYKVVAGDSLSMIAQRHKVSVDALKRANKLTSNNVKVGQVLQIP